jgi:hypothetical protein
MELGDKDLTVSLFEQYPIRRVWVDDEWWYSVVDCVGAITQSKNPRNYWSMMKRRLKADEGLDVYTIGVRIFRLPDSVGRVQATDCADMQAMLRIIQSIKHRNAEPFKQWLAQVGSQKLAAEDERVMRAAYRLQLYQFDLMLHEVVSYRGIETPQQHTQLDEANYQGLYEMASRHAIVLHRKLPYSALPPGGFEPFMGAEELGANIFQRTQAAARIQANNSQGEQIYRDAQDVGTEIRRTLERLGRPMPEDMPTYPMLRADEWAPPDVNPNLPHYRLDWHADPEEPSEEYAIVPVIELLQSDDAEKAKGEQ